MPDSKFLETYTLYRKFEGEFPRDLNRMPAPAINMTCHNSTCDDGNTRTFNLKYKYNHTVIDAIRNNSISVTQAYQTIVNAVYVCTSCTTYQRTFHLLFDFDMIHVMKVGQYPPWREKIKPELKKLLGDQTDLYQKALILESQSYGIGAFAYYRRIVEEQITKLVEDIEVLIPESDKAAYQEAVERVRETHIASDKIELVKDLLPSSLKPNNINPLDIIYGHLSGGLHGKDEEECLEIAESLRESVIYLITKVYENRDADKEFSERMKKLLEKKSV